MSLVSQIRAAWTDPDIRAKSIEADVAFRELCTEDMARIPGCDTVLRMSVRILHGQSAEQAAAREYAYRWHIFADRWVNHAESHSRGRLVPSIWTAPHLIGA